MRNRNVYPKTFAAVFAIILISSTAFSVAHRVADDVDEAIRTVMKMKDPILNAKAAEVEQLAKQAIEYSEKALNATKDEDNRKALNGAIVMLRGLIKDVQEDRWNQAGTSWTQILELLADAK